jgi:hypothetical protein
MRKNSKIISLKMNSPDLIKRAMIAPCGMNCALCSGYLRENKLCEGCRSGGNNTPNYCKKCIIRNCENLKKARRPYCFDCKGYPCVRLKRLDKRYRSRYGMSMLENLEHIRQSGILSFVRKEKERWACRQCGGIVSVHRRECLFCGKEKSPAQLMFHQL